MKSLRSFPTRMAMLAGVVLAFGPTSKADDDVPALTKDNGPFMVLAYTFRGPEAENNAKALAKELKKDHDLPAFLYQAPGKAESPNFGVLVGNCKSVRETNELRNRVKKIEPKCLANTPTFQKGKGLSRAMTTTNPLVPPEVCFPRK
jgi:hypothetical protein